LVRVAISRRHLRSDYVAAHRRVVAPVNSRETWSMSLYATPRTSPLVAPTKIPKEPRSSPERVPSYAPAQCPIPSPRFTFRHS
jgi:hypothetical protein